MTRLETKDWILFIFAILLGITGGLWELYALIPLSLIILFVSLSTSAKFKHHELSFLFPLSFVSCFPANLRLSRRLVEIIDFLDFSTIRRMFYFLFFLLVLISIEELLLGVGSFAIWGTQEAVFYKDEDEKDPKTNGHYLKEITENEED